MVKSAWSKRVVKDLGLKEADDLGARGQSTWSKRVVKNLGLEEADELGAAERQAVVDIVREVVQRALGRLLGLRVLPPCVCARVCV